MFILKIILNFFVKKFFLKVGLSYLNIFLGGFFGFLRGIILVFFIFYFDNLFGLNYLKNSLLINFFIYKKLFIFNKFYDFF